MNGFYNSGFILPLPVVFFFLISVYSHLDIHVYFGNCVHCGSLHQNLQGFRILHILYNKTYNNDLENFGA